MSPLARDRVDDAKSSLRGHHRGEQKACWKHLVGLSSACCEEVNCMISSNRKRFGCMKIDEAYCIASWELKLASLFTCRVAFWRAVHIKACMNQPCKKQRGFWSPGKLCLSLRMNEGSEAVWCTMMAILIEANKSVGFKTVSVKDWESCPCVSWLFQQPCSFMGSW